MANGGKITVVIPCYNECTRLPVTLSELASYAQRNKGVIGEVVCVDDGSHDGTAEWVMRYAEKLPIRLIRHVKNEGKWAAVNTGMRGVKGLVLLMDADGSASIWELNRCGGFPERKFAVFGTRYGEGATVQGKSFLRSIVSQGYRWYVGNAYGLAGGHNIIKDMQCPLKLFHVEDVQGELVTKRFAGDIELAFRLDGVMILNHAVQFTHVRGSRVPLRAVWNMFTETASIAKRFHTGQLIETIK